ncbi:hypothetical protein AYI68_g6368, partial [Smittium mucronatum]
MSQEKEHIGFRNANELLVLIPNEKCLVPERFTESNGNQGLPLPPPPPPPPPP